MLIGLVLGWMLDESFSDALLGALLGLGIGQAIRIARLVRRPTNSASAGAGASRAACCRATAAVLEVRRAHYPRTGHGCNRPVRTSLPRKPGRHPGIGLGTAARTRTVAAVATETSQPLPVDAWKPGRRCPQSPTLPNSSRPEPDRARHQRCAQLAVRRQHRAAGRRGAVVPRSGVPAALCHRRHGGADRVALRRRRGGGLGLLGWAGGCAAQHNTR
jgi:hypothetical protein